MNDLFLPPPFNVAVWMWIVLEQDIFAWTVQHLRFVVRDSVLDPEDAVLKIGSHSPFFFLCFWLSWRIHDREIGGVSHPAGWGG